MCGCNGKTNQATMTPDQIVAAAQARADEARAIREMSKSSAENAVANASR